ncbi:hypothetical protein [Nitrosococcus watsonii]|uniref:Uncharacterized protein n=1 Tax=Nitrosococcus watsoni (strain C-113) TaxID=105559 RepID=D8K9B8_NITWC|nr:hypothetical protein [Nitrosococcus watsonii]ADJ29261.1 hypothetical protein Nwat_2450 [Nitrosococcus watsonii C-113]
MVLPLSPEEREIFITRQFARNHWPFDTDGKLWAGRRRDDLLLWNQRGAMDDWFGDYLDDIALLGDTGRPWDHDHIVPSNFFNHYRPSPADLKLVLQDLHLDQGAEQSLWNKFRDFRNHTGNYRAWPLGFNRADGDQCAREKLSQRGTLDPWVVLAHWWEETIEHAESGTHPLREASAIEISERWDETPKNKGEWELNELSAFLESVRKREARLYQALFDFIKPGFAEDRFHDRV